MSSWPSSDICSSWVNPSTAFSGVRSSWLVLDRNAFFAWVAFSATSLAAVSSVVRLSRRPLARASAAISRPISSPAPCTGSRSSPAPSLSAFEPASATRLEMPEVNSVPPITPASTPKARPQMITASMSSSSRFMSLRRTVTRASGPRTRPLSCCLSESMVALPDSRWGRRATSLAPSAAWVRSCASSAISLAAVASAVRAAGVTPSTAAAARSAARSVGMRFTVVL